MPTPYNPVNDLPKYIDPADLKYRDYQDPNRIIKIKRLGNILYRWKILVLEKKTNGVIRVSYTISKVKVILRRDGKLIPSGPYKIDNASAHYLKCDDTGLFHKISNDLLFLLSKRINDTPVTFRFSQVGFTPRTQFYSSTAAPVDDLLQLLPDAQDDDLALQEYLRAIVERDKFFKEATLHKKMAYTCADSASPEWPWMRSRDESTQRRLADSAYQKSLEWNNIAEKQATLLMSQYNSDKLPISPLALPPVIAKELINSQLGL